MKALWNIVSVLAVANLLAFALVGAWLVGTDRLDKQRVERVRTLLGRTISAENAESESMKSESERMKAEGIAAERMAIPPIPAAAIIATARLAQDAELQVDLRRQRELEDLRASLLRLQAGLEARETELMAQMMHFEETKRLYASIEGADQFKTALSTLEGQRAKDAKLVLQALLSIGQHEQVVAYLANMDEGKRSKVVAEFVKDSPSVAADLLERLRTRGTTLGREVASGVSKDAQRDPNAP